MTSELVHTLCNPPALPFGSLVSAPWTEDRTGLFKQLAHNRGTSEEQVIQTCIYRVLMKRGCTCAESRNALVFLAFGQSNCMTGRAISLTGEQDIH